MGKINLKKLYILYACLNGVLAGVYVLFLRGHVQGFPTDQDVSLATGAALLASILVCAFAAWKWGTNAQMVKGLFLGCFWTYCALTYGQAFTPYRATHFFIVKVQPLILLILLGEGVLAGVVMRFQAEELDPELYNEEAQLSENGENPYDAFLKQIIIAFFGLMFYWAAWSVLEVYS